MYMPGRLRSILIVIAHEKIKLISS